MPVNRHVLKRIQTRIRFLKRACDNGVHPTDIDSLWLMHEQLTHTTVLEMEKEKIDFIDLIKAVHAIDELLPILEMGEPNTKKT